MNERVKQLLVLGREHYAKREFEKAEQMLHGGSPSDDDSQAPGDDYTETDRATNEQDLSQDQ